MQWESIRRAPTDFSWRSDGAHQEHRECKGSASGSLRRTSAGGLTDRIRSIRNAVGAHQERSDGLQLELRLQLGELWGKSINGSMDACLVNPRRPYTTVHDNIAASGDLLVRSYTIEFDRIRSACVYLWESVLAAF